MEDNTPPEIITFKFDIQRSGRVPECIFLLSRVMENYDDLEPKERHAIAVWFRALYGNSEHVEPKRD